jgi:hypothetical protein
MSLHARGALCPLILAAVFSLAGCNASAPPPVAAVAAPDAYAARTPPPDLNLPPGAACTADIEQWRPVLEDDLQTGNLNQSVYDQIQSDIAAAAPVCRAGRDAQARGMIAASKRKHGYHA